MSLILGARCKGGILLAADPFVFNNDGDLPQKRLDFSRFLISPQCDYAIVSIGSQWVFQQFKTWIESGSVQRSQLLEALSEKWAELSKYWKSTREK